MTDEKSSPPPAQGPEPPGPRQEPQQSREPPQPEPPQPEPPQPEPRRPEQLQPEPAQPEQHTARQSGADSDEALSSSQGTARRLREAMNAALGAAAHEGPAQAPGRLERSAPGFPEPELAAQRPSRPVRAPESGKRDGLTAKDGASKPWSEVAKRVALRIALLGLALSLLGAIFVFFLVRHHEANLPSVEQLKAGYDPPQVTRVLARDGTLLANLFTERRTVVAFSSIPNHVKQAFLAAEDASFYEHEGLDYLGMLRAMLANLRAGKTTQGGSTITQQVIKNVLLDSERSYRRKIRETILARRVEQHLTKDEIFGLYLNHIYLGHGRYGVEEASRYYFGKKVEEIDISEAALLAGLIAAPERYSPRKHPERALQRRRYVLGQMLQKGFMTQAVHGQASIVPLKLAPAVEAESEICPEVIATVRKTLEAVEPDRARRGGYIVHTTIDPGLQTAARQAVRRSLDNYLERQKLQPPYTLKSRKLWGKPFQGTPKQHHIYVATVVETNDAAGTVDVMVGDTLGRLLLKDEERYNPQRLPPSEFTRPGASLRVAVLESPSGSGGAGPIPVKLELGPQAALVAIDVRTREVRALIGSYEAVMGGLDRTGSNASDDTLLTKRQPGSAFKPLMYSYALHSRHVTPATVFEFDSAPGSEEPTRHISLREGVAKSDNDVAERVLKQVGAANVVAWAKAMGIGSNLKPDLSLALGSYEVSVFELTNAYATLASGGSYAPPKLVTKVVTPDGSELALPPEPPKRRVMSVEEAYLTTSLLRGVVEHGTGRRAQVLDRPIAGKTGTTNKNRDAWFVGYSTDLVTGSWVGYDDSLPLGWGEYGAVAALPAWIDFMKYSHQGRPRTQFPRPAGIVKTAVDPKTGLLPYPGQEDTIEEEFLEDSLPTETAPSPDSEIEDEAGADEEPTGEGADRDPDAPAPEAQRDAGAEVPAPEAEATGEPEAPEPDGATSGSAALPAPEPPPF